MAKKAVPGAGSTQPVPKAKQIKVQATRTGYYDHIRRREGDVFVIDEKDFSERWMVRVAARTPEKTTTAQEALRREHDDILAGRAGSSVTDADVI